MIISVKLYGFEKQTTLNDLDKPMHVCCAATFYGASLLYLPLNESITRLQLQFNFLTGRSGPLFSASGSVDFLYVDVTQSGRVVASVDLGAGRATVTSPPGISTVADRRWHSVVVVLGRFDLQLILDDVFESRATLPGDFMALNVDVGLLLGVRFAEVPAAVSTESLPTMTFRGCLREVNFNGVDVLAAARRTDTASQMTVVTWNRSEPKIIS